MAPHEDIDTVVVVTDTNPEEKRREYVFTEVSNLLWCGIVIGFGICVCMFGILQQFVELINTSETVRMLVQKLWFNIQWWYWIGPLGFFGLMYLFVRSSGRRKFLKKNL